MKILGNTGITKLINLISSKFAPLNSPNLTGTPTAPTASADTNTTQVATTAFVNTKTNNYLPLTGGTMSGEIIQTQNSAIRRNVDNSSLTLYGGTEGTSAYINLIGKNNSTNPGHFMIRAIDGTNNAFLDGAPNGTLTWAGKNVAWDVKTGTANGTISVNGSNVSVYGLGSRAYDSTAYLPLAGGTMTGGLTWLGGSDGTALCGFKFGGGTAANNFYAANFTSMDFGWNWDTGAGSGMAFRSAAYGGAQAGAFIFFARNNTSTAVQLEGHVDGALSWSGTKFTLGSHANITYNASTACIEFSFV